MSVSAKSVELENIKFQEEVIGTVPSPEDKPYILEQVKYFNNRWVKLDTVLSSGFIASMKNCWFPPKENYHVIPTDDGIRLLNALTALCVFNSSENGLENIEGYYSSWLENFGTSSPDVHDEAGSLVTHHSSTM